MQSVNPKRKCKISPFKTYAQKTPQTKDALDHGCGTVDSSVASDTTGPMFESSQRQLLLSYHSPDNCFQKRRK